MSTILHLHNDVFTLISGAIDVKNNVSTIRRNANLLIVFKFELCDFEFIFKQIVEKSNEQVLANFPTKDMFKSPIGKRVYKFRHTTYSALW